MTPKKRRERQEELRQRAERQAARAIDLIAKGDMVLAEYEALALFRTCAQAREASWDGWPEDADSY